MNVITVLIKLCYCAHVCGRCGRGTSMQQTCLACIRSSILVKVRCVEGLQPQISIANKLTLQSEYLRNSISLARPIKPHKGGNQFLI